jgi:predicted metal-dependent peptidase
VGEFITSVPALYDVKFEGKSSEEIYDYLYENAEKINMDDLLDRIIDEHMDGDEEGDGNGSDGEDGKDGKKKRPKLSQEERDKIRDEIKEAMLSAAQTCDAGNLPGGVKRLIQQLTEPKMDWRELLRMQLESTIKSDYTWLRSSRKGWHVDAVMPGMKTTDAIDIAIAIDTSGSILDKQTRDFLSEIRGIMETFESYRIHVFTFDTQVYNPQQYDSDNLEDIEDYDVQGCGGTDFEAIFQYLKDADIEPKKLVVFTDGFPFGSWGDPNYCDTVWIIHSNKNPEPPFGVWAEYEENAK